MQGIEILNKEPIYNMPKSMVVILVVAIAIGGTVAYLTSEDSDVNVMTMGNVKIVQNEYEWNDAGDALVEFTQAKPLHSMLTGESILSIRVLY